MKGFIMILKHILVIGLVFLFLNGCSKQNNIADQNKANIEQVKENDSHLPEITLCGKCGQVKGTAICCTKDAKKCDCGAVKGSPACCKIKLAGADITLCDHCGQVKGSEICCKSDTIKCSKCGKAKESPGCFLNKDHHHS